MIDIDVTNLEKLAKRIGNANVVGAINTGIQKGVYYLEGIAKEETPIDTGKLRNSYRSRFSSLYGQLVNTSKYGLFVHEGTKPHMVSSTHLRAWANRKGLPASAVVRSIMVRGTQPNRFMDRTKERGEEWVRTILKNEIISTTQRVLWV